jgi:hypothetical protein
MKVRCNKCNCELDAEHFSQPGGLCRWCLIDIENQKKHEPKAATNEA